MAVKTERSKVLYAVHISFTGRSSSYSRWLSLVVKMLSGWHIVGGAGWLLPLIDEPTEEIEKKTATIDLSNYAGELHRLYGFFIDKKRREGGCEDYPLPHMHLNDGGIEDIGAAYGAFYLPSIKRGACLDARINALVDTQRRDS